MNHSTSSRGKSIRGYAADAVAIALTLTLAGGVVANAANRKANREGRKAVPESRDIEGKAGMRIKGAELVADGGLVIVRYTVLDPDKVEKTQAKEGKAGGARAEGSKSNKALAPSGGMRHSHKLRAGQSTFTMYQNTGGAVKKGDTLDLMIEGSTLKNVPVE
jgi:hypothetical protein